VRSFIEPDLFDNYMLFDNTLRFIWSICWGNSG